MSQRLLAFFISAILVLGCLRQTAPQPNPEDMKRYWQVLVPSLRSVLKQSFPSCCVEPSYSPTWNGHYPVRIVQTADITGDGVPEALVYLGDGGAYTDYVTVMRIEDGKAVVPLFKDASGKLSSTIFLQGASVRHGEAVRMLPDKHAIYWMSTSTDDQGRADTCAVRAYQWELHQRIFLWNKLLSKQIAGTDCPKGAF